MNNRFIIVLSLSFLFVGILNAGKRRKVLFTNPVVAKNLPDPTVIRGKDNNFYLFATQGKQIVPIYKSKNLVNWDLVGSAFTNESKPNFEPKAGIWAPDINYINGKYVMYYSMSVWGGEWTCGIGVAISDNPFGPFTDLGKLFRSNEIGVQNSIDPFYIEDNGRKFLFWGSFRGIFFTELTSDGLQLKNDSIVKQVAGTAFEGTYIYKRDKYYYFFASVGTCCEGINSTYKLVVGRSNSLFGPYVDKSGKSLMDNGFELVIDKNERFVGNGHNAEIVKDKKKNDWILFHGVDVQNPKGRVLLLDRIYWDKEGWPYVKNNNTPSLEHVMPSF